jgi:diaminopimelate epimerase
MTTGKIAGTRGVLLSGAGNCFILIDGREELLPADLPRLAKRLCRKTFADGFRADGVLTLSPPKRGGDLAFAVYNRDGSRPETCGNGLRCVGQYVRSSGFDAERLVIETDAGLSELSFASEDVNVCMGIAAVVEEKTQVALQSHDLRATLVNVGNPHCVLFVEDERHARVAEWGHELEKHRRFDSGTNVEFVSERAGRLYARVWERGVGETEACGSGACAIAAAAALRFGKTFPMELEMPGGLLRITRDDRGRLWLSGPVKEIGDIDV